MNKKLIAMGSTLLLSAAMLAQESTPANDATPAAPAATNNAQSEKPTINQRKRNQQRRIRQGVKSGELTKGETRRLEKQERAMNQEERDMRKMDNGHLTQQDRKTLNQQQNQMSKKIYRDKHNKNKRHS